MLEVLFEDSNLLVVNKPSGMTVNNSKTSGEVTVQNLVALAERNTEGGEVMEELGEDVGESDTEQSEFEQRGGIVHRLDKDTSGVLIVAKNEMSFKRLQKQFKRRTVEKEYIALVDGEIGDVSFEVDAPIGRNPKNRMKYAVVSDGKEALTRFEKVAVKELESGVVTVLRVFPKTGRTHQIRVHLAALDHSVISDPIYSTKQQYDKWESQFKRLMLHAHKVSFDHPETGERVSVEAPIPSEFMIY